MEGGVDVNGPKRRRTRRLGHLVSFFFKFLCLLLLLTYVLLYIAFNLRNTRQWRTALTKRAHVSFFFPCFCCVFALLTNFYLQTATTTLTHLTTRIARVETCPSRLEPRLVFSFLVFLFTDKFFTIRLLHRLNASSTTTAPASGTIHDEWGLEMRPRLELR